MARTRVAVPIAEPDSEELSAPLQPAFDYTRSVGPIMGKFFTSIREHTLLGIADESGAVHVPPIEFDPQPHRPLSPDALVPVGPEGTVQTWTWVAEPKPSAVLQTPHALALITLDGATTAMLHVVDAEPGEMATGMRVTAVWSPDAAGSIRDVHFRPVGDTASGSDGRRGRHQDPLAVGLDDSGRLVTPFRGDYQHTAGFAERVYLRGLYNGRFIGRRRSNGPEVYVPPRDWCPSDGVAMGEFVEVADVGTVTTFAIVNLPFAGQKITPPYVTAYILLDGSDTPIQHLVLGCDAAEVRMGMRVKAAWVDPADRVYSMGSISYFEPTGEPDAPAESYAAHI